MTASDYLQAAIDSGRVISVDFALSQGSLGRAKAFVVEPAPRPGLPWGVPDAGLAVLLEPCGPPVGSPLLGGGIVAFHRRGEQYIVANGKHLQGINYDPRTA